MPLRQNSRDILFSDLLLPNLKLLPHCVYCDCKSLVLHDCLVLQNHLAVLGFYITESIEGTLCFRFLVYFLCRIKAIKAVTIIFFSFLFARQINPHILIIYYLKLFPLSISIFYFLKKKTKNYFYYPGLVYRFFRP
jgi:hypothetical protein